MQSNSATPLFRMLFTARLTGHRLTTPAAASSIRTSVWREDVIGANITLRRFEGLGQWPAASPCSVVLG